MTKAKEEQNEVEPSLQELVLESKKDLYKISYAALRWAKEIKQKENLPDLVGLLIPRALREILTNKVTIKDIEKLPVHVKLTPPPPPTPAPAAPAAPQQTIILKPIKDSEDSDDKKEKPSEQKGDKEKK